MTDAASYSGNRLHTVIVRPNKVDSVRDAMENIIKKNIVFHFYQK